MTINPLKRFEKNVKPKNISMKKFFLLPTVFIALGVCFTSCKENRDKEENVTEIDKIGTEETGKDEIAYSEFSQYDANSDSRYDRKEYKETYKNRFSELDSDSDGSLNKDEFYAATFEFVNEDADNFISEEEWDKGNENILKERTAGKDFSAFDTNKDKQISSEEWKKAFEQSNWFVTYDANKDEMIQEDEWDNGFFDDWDLDDDGSWNEEEFNNFTPKDQEGS